MQTINDFWVTVVGRYTDSEGLQVPYYSGYTIVIVCSDYWFLNMIPTPRHLPLLVDRLNDINIEQLKLRLQGYLEECKNPDDDDDELYHTFVYREIIANFLALLSAEK